MTKFSKYWDNTVKPTIDTYLGIENKQDKTSAYYISKLRFSIEHDLADGRVGGSMILLEQCRATLNSKSYWTNVWNDYESSEEARALRVVAAGIQKLSREERD